MKIVSYSKNLFIPLTNACRNSCSYCGFRSDNPEIMSKEEVLQLLKKGRTLGCKEALFTFGESPESQEEIKGKLEDWGYSTIIEYLYDLCSESIGLGLLPHSNPGVIEKKDLKLLKEVNASMGLMLESSSKRLCEPGMPHEKSPGKDPLKRLKILREAGNLKIPFTTGILVGIGETDQELRDSLDTLKKVQERYGHIQELIIQNFRPKPKTPMQYFPEPSISRMIYALRYAKRLFPNIGLQVPPNLNPGREGEFLIHGANDFGGISPLTQDFVNPEDRWPSIEFLRETAKKYGFTLRERLPVYPSFFDLAPERLRSIIYSYVDKEGYVDDSD